MRRRQQEGTPPPAELVEYDAAVWLPRVDPDGYRADHYRNRNPDGPYGPVRYTFEAWHRDRARGLWRRARQDWCAEPGWPGGLTRVDLLREEGRAVREPWAARRPGRGDPSR